MSQEHQNSLTKELRAANLSAIAYGAPATQRLMPANITCLGCGTCWERKTPDTVLKKLKNGCPFCNQDAEEEQKQILPPTSIRLRPKTIKLLNKIWNQGVVIFYWGGSKEIGYFGCKTDPDHEPWFEAGSNQIRGHGCPTCHPRLTDRRRRKSYTFISLP